jgi:nitrogen fixation NifU-like protein
MNDDLSDLYQEIILSHNKRPRNEGELDPCDGKAEGFNPLCGDKISVFVKKGAGDVLEAVTFLGEGCAISRASASIMTSQLTSLSIEEVNRRIEEITIMLTQVEEPDMDLAKVGDFAALAGVRKFPSRIKCATLAWHTLRSALQGGGSATTE